MRDNLTELVFILDRSGSMSSMSKEAIGGFNAFLEEQKKCAGEARLSLVLFDHEYELVHSGVNIKDVMPLCDDTYSPRGTTALLDAIGRSVDDVGKRLADLEEKDRPSKVLVAVLTDGLENASRDYKKSVIGEMLAHQRDKYSWEFIFLGANMDAIAEGTSLGMLANCSMTYDFSSAGMTRAFKSVSRAATSYRTSGDVGDFQKDDDKSNDA